MTTSIIVAASENNVIGLENNLPWNLPEDMKFFKNTTWGMPVIMGRKTFEGLNGKPLPGRKNIVITRQTNWKPAGVEVVNSYNEALKIAETTDCNEAFVIGGGEIFKDLINKVDKIHLTRIHAVINGDAYFPEIDPSIWELKKKRDCPADDRHLYSFTFETWEKKGNGE